MRKWIKWTKEEETILRQMWGNPEISLKDMATVLKSRNSDSIKMKARSLDLPLLGGRQTPEVDLEYYQKLMEVVEG